MFWVFFSLGPEYVVISLLEATFPDTLGAPWHCGSCCCSCVAPDKLKRLSSQVYVLCNVVAVFIKHIRPLDLFDTIIMR